MTNTQSKEIIENEEFDLKQSNGELKKLKVKWIKIPSTLRLINFLENYIKQKEIFISKIKILNT